MNSERLTMLFLAIEITIIILFSIKVIKIRYLRWLNIIFSSVGMLSFGSFLFVKSIKIDIIYRFSTDIETNGRIYFMIGAALVTVLVFSIMKLVDNIIRKKHRIS